MATKEHPECPNCICGKRAPVQAAPEKGKGPGSIAWEEHERIWAVYAAKYGAAQSAQRMAERGGFGYREIVFLTGNEPTTWLPVSAKGRT